MARYTPNDLTGALAPINAELEKIKLAVDDTLSRKGDNPNAMEASLDMNSNRLYNLPDAVTAKEPVTLSQLLDAPASKLPKDTEIIQHLKQLADVDTSKTPYVYVKGFYTGSDVGGGLFYWDSTRDKAEHNVGVIVDPTRLEVWDGTATGLVSLYALGTGTGCFVRLDERLSLSGTVKTSWFGACGEDLDFLCVQSAVDSYDFVDGENVSHKITQAINLSGDYKTLQGGSWDWASSSALNVFNLTGTMKSPKFKSMKFTSSLSPFISLGAIGCTSGVETDSWLVEDCEFDGVPFGVYFNADTSGKHVNPTAKYCKFKNIKRFLDDSSGAGLGLVFASQLGGIFGGKSVGNYFYKTGRHALYSSAGGNVTSTFDTFEEHRNDGSSLVQSGLSALALSRNANNCKVIMPVFKRCKDLSFSAQGVSLGGSPTFGAGIDLIYPTFDGNLAGDIEINNDSPTTNGFIDNITVASPKIFQYGENADPRILVFAGRNIKISDVKVYADSSLGATSPVNIVRVEDVTSDTAQFNNIVVDGVYGTGTSLRGVAVDAGVLTSSIKLTLKDIDYGTTPIFESATVPINPNYLKITGDKPVIRTAFTGSFTNQNSEINRVDKYAGKKIFSLSGGLIKPLYATGALATSTWVDASGTVVHTPA